MLSVREYKKDLFKEMGTEMGNPEEVVFCLGKKNELIYAALGLVVGDGLSSSRVWAVC